MVSVMAAMGLTVLLGITTKSVSFLYYPMIRMSPNSVWTILVYVSYACLCMLPLFVNVIEDVKWHYLKSKI